PRRQEHDALLGCRRGRAGPGRATVVAGLAQSELQGLLRRGVAPVVRRFRTVVACGESSFTCREAILAIVLLAGPVHANEISITPRDLYEGLEARKVILEASGARLALDPRVFQFGARRLGVVVTDPIDLGPHPEIASLAATIASVDVEVLATRPSG